MTTIHKMIESGILYRKKVCQRCGAEKMEKLISYRDTDWVEEPVFEQSGFGTVVIVPYDLPALSREELNLCVNCSAELQTLLDNFKDTSEFK